MQVYMSRNQEYAHVNTVKTGREYTLFYFFTTTVSDKVSSPKQWVNTT